MNFRLNIMELEPKEKEMLLLGMISQAIRDSKMMERSKQKNTERKKPRLKWCYGSKKICKETFLYLMDISRNLFTPSLCTFGNMGLFQGQKSRFVKVSSYLKYDWSLVVKYNN